MYVVGWDPHARGGDVHYLIANWRKIARRRGFRTRLASLGLASRGRRGREASRHDRADTVDGKAPLVVIQVSGSKLLL